MVFPYRQGFVCSYSEFMLQIYHQNINLGITFHNNKSSIVIFSVVIQLLMSTSIVIIVKHLAWYIASLAIMSPSPSFSMIAVFPNSCEIFLKILLTSNFSHLWSFSSQSLSPQKKQFGRKFRKSTLLRLTWTSVGSDSEQFSGASQR